MGIYKRKDPDGHFVAYRDFRADPLAHLLKRPPAKSRFTPVSWRILLPLAVGKRMKRSTCCRFTPPLSKADDPCATSSRCSFSVFTTKPEPTPAGTSMCCRPPAAEVWINPLDAGSAELKTAICARLQPARRIAYSWRKSCRVSCPA